MNKINFAEYSIWNGLFYFENKIMFLLLYIIGYKYPYGYYKCGIVCKNEFNSKYCTKLYGV